MPLILSASHGGYLTPSTVHTRNCVGCVTGRDAYTQELTRELTNAIKAKTGCYPHVIINRLHRKKLDANREIIEATDSTTATEIYWHEYNNYVDSAREKIKRTTTKGLFIDIHGHGHTIQRLEIGYLLSKTNLQQSNTYLNSTSMLNKSSIKNLSASNLNSISHSDLIRGNSSLGTMLADKGYPGVPSSAIPFPLSSEPYFQGGYNTKKWGSKNGGQIDGIQIEHNQYIRFDSTRRKNYADSLAAVLLNYIEKHYFLNFHLNYCSTASLKEIKLSETVLFPNPSRGVFTIKTHKNIQTISVYSISGKLVLKQKKAKKINISELNNGVYFVKIEYNNSVSNHRIVKY